MIVLGSGNSRIFQCFLWICLVSFALGSISIIRVTSRVPKEKDIGLIFDLNLINTATEEKELLEYNIRSERECCVNLTENRMMSNAGKIVGGSFGFIEPGEMKTISVVWPTTELFNRVGHCYIVITSINRVKEEEKQLKQLLQFDTRFSQIDPTSTTFRKRKDYKECPNWDMDFLNNCSQVNCEAKYLGKRNFFNTTTQRCEPASKCKEKNQIYDIYSNDCLNVDELMDPEELENIKKGLYENNTLNCGESNSDHKDVKRNNEDYFLVPLTLDDRPPVWPQVLSGLTIAIATVVIYSSVCFLIFLLVNWVSKMSAKKAALK